MHITMRFTAGLAIGLGVVHQTAVLAFAIHQHKAGRVPQFIAEVAIAFAALAVEIDAAA